MGGERRRRGRAAEPRAQSQADEEPEAQIQADEEPEEQCSSLRGSEDKRGEEREGYSSRRKIGNWRRNTTGRRSVKVDFYHRLHVIFSNTAIAWQLTLPLRGSYRDLLYCECAGGRIPSQRLECGAESVSPTCEWNPRVIRPPHYRLWCLVLIAAKTVQNH